MFACVRAHLYEHMQMYVHVCMGRSEVDTVYFPGLLCTLHTEGEFPMEMPTLANESGQTVGSGNSSFLPP